MLVIVIVDLAQMGFPFSRLVRPLVRKKLSVGVSELAENSGIPAMEAGIGPVGS